MASNYVAIRQSNREEYGAGIGRWGKDVLAIRYDERTHFIFELLQNTEDALAHRPDWQEPRSVSFHLVDRALRVSHFGKPFDHADVRGICGIAEGAKDLTAIGRFGIGFKSVYAFTDRPEIHSGDEDFAIENFVWPVAAPALDRGVHETVIVIPLKASTEADHEEIAAGLQRLGVGALLFLRQIEEISWSVQGGHSGLYLRESEEMDAGVRRITVIGQEQRAAEIEETWVVFSRPVTADGGLLVGQVEIAFSTAKGDGSEREAVQRVEPSPLVVFFPTVLETHLGFQVQGPYRTTPSRDNVPRKDPWNRYLVSETAILLVDALGWLRDHDLLNTATLRCLPLDSGKFGEGTMFTPLFDSTKQALSSEPLLPRFDTGHVAAASACLARTQELRELFTPRQLAALFGHGDELVWLSGEITQDRTPELRRYLIDELGIEEITPDSLVRQLDKPFLQAQPDSWILDLYQFLNGQTALRRRLEDLPLIRLDDGTHVVAHVNGHPQAFLPGEIKTGFPTVRASVCTTESARGFLRTMGLTEPDPVDDVVRNVLPKYQKDEVDVGDPEYEADIGRILAAFATDSKGQRDKLLQVLRETAFVISVDVASGSKFSKPAEVYLATERLKELFASVNDVLLVDDSYGCLRGEGVRELLEACGATRYLQPIAVRSTFTGKQLLVMRVAAGCESISYQYQESIEDQTLRGLEGLLKLVPQVDSAARAKKASLLWEALGELEDRRGTGVFSGTYRWHYYHRRSATFDAAFVRKLNETVWVPDGNGEPQRPEFVLFESLGWKPNPFLRSKIHFKPPIIETLAREAGIEPGVLDLLKKYGLTSEAELKARLGITEEPQQVEAKPGSEAVDDALKNLGVAAEPTPAVPDLAGPEPVGFGSAGAGPGARSGHGAGARGGGQDAGRTNSSGPSAGRRPQRGADGRPFISYVGAHPDDEEADTDGLDQPARMALEEKAIAFILEAEPQLQRTATHNPGFDLFESSEDGEPVRWIEVKAMTGGLHDRPVGLSRTQFECAREHWEAYWLYVVEHAGNDRPRIVRIPDPAGKARTFTFDHGWLDVADADDEPEPQED